MMGIGQAITMPLFFTSNAIYPIDVMPPWLRVIATFNPLSYLTDAMRSLLLTGDFQGIPLDIGVTLLATAIFATIAAVLFRRILE
jgi:ABC-2 type transport system permease protein